MQRKIENDCGTSLARRAAAVGCLLLGLAGQAVFALFVLLLGLDWLPDRPTLPAPWPWVVDLGWRAAGDCAQRFVHQSVEGRLSI